MKYMPDSAIAGTIGHAKRRSAKARRRAQGSETLQQAVPGGFFAIYLLSCSVIGIAIVYVMMR